MAIDETVTAEEYDEEEADAEEYYEAVKQSADMREAEELARRLWPGHDHHLDSWARCEARDLVRENRFAVLALAGALVERRRLDEVQIGQILQVVKPIRPRGACPYAGYLVQL